MRTVRAEKFRTDSIPPQPTAIACLAAIGGIHEFYADPISLRSIGYSPYQKTVAKTIKLSASSFPSEFFFRDLFKFQVFQNQNGIFWNPLAKLCSGLVAKCFGKILLFPRQTFQDTANRTVVFAQFLFRGFFRLNSRSSFSGSFSLFKERFSRNTKSLFLGRSNQNIPNANIDPNWSYALWIGDFKSNAKTSFRSSANTQGIHDLCIEEIFLKSLWDSKSELLSSSDSPDRHFSVFRKGSISASLPDQKQSSFFSKNKRPFSWFLVGFCRHIRRSYKPNSGTFHLRRQTGRLRFVNLFVKSQSAARLTGVKAYFGNALLISIEFLNSFQQIFRLFESDWYASLYQHANSVPLNQDINNLKWRPRFPLALKDEVPARAI